MKKIYLNNYPDPANRFAGAVWYNCECLVSIKDLHGSGYVFISPFAYRLQHIRESTQSYVATSQQRNRKTS